MSNEWKGYYGKDGKRYKDVVELWNANRVVENQEEQTRLLKMNAELAVLQAEQEERKLQQARDIENERQEHEKQMQQEKYEHERELLLLKIFDEVSIPLGVYTKFEDKLLSGAYMSQEDTEQYANLMKSATEIVHKKMERGEQFQELLQSNMSYPNSEVKYTDKYKVFQNFINNNKSITNIKASDFDVFDNDKQSLINSFNKTKEDIQQKKNYLSFTVNLNYILSIVELIAGLFILPDFKILFIPAAIIQFIVATWAKSNNKVEQEATKEFKTQLNKSINTQMVNEYSQDSTTEEEKNIMDKVKQSQEKLHESSKIVIDQGLKELYNFRLEHYNLKIEKLFYDVGLVNKCIENNYNWLDIDKKNIKSEGTYEDYFHYFNNYDPNNEKPQEE